MTEIDLLIKAGNLSGRAEARKEVIDFVTAKINECGTGLSVFGFAQDLSDHIMSLSKKDAEVAQVIQARITTTKEAPK